MFAYSSALRNLTTVALCCTISLSSCVSYRSTGPVVNMTGAAAVGTAAVAAREARDAFEGIAIASAAAQIVSLSADLYFLEIDMQANSTIIWTMALLRNLPEEQWANCRIEFKVPAQSPRYKIEMRRSRNRVAAPGIELEVDDYAQTLLVKEGTPYHPNYIFWPDDLIDENPYWGPLIKQLQQWLIDNPQQSAFNVVVEHEKGGVKG